MTRSLPLAACLVVLAALLPACKKAAKTPPPAGAPLMETPARKLAVFPGGKAVAFVSEVAKPPEASAPEGVLQGVLVTAALGSAPRQLGGGVTTLDDAFRFSADGAFVAYLQGYRFRDQSGSLHLVRMPSGEPELLGPSVRFYGFSPDGRRLAYVNAGQLKLLDLETRETRTVAAQVATFEFARDSSALLARQQLAAGGDLLLVPVSGGEPRKVGERVGDYAFSPDGSHFAFSTRLGGPADPYALFVASRQGAELRRVGEDVTSFSFSPDGSAIAFQRAPDPRRPYGDLYLAQVAGGEPRKVGNAVLEHRWSPDSRSLAVRESLEDQAGRKWHTFKVVSVPEGKERLKETGTASFNFPRFAFSPDGAYLAYLKPVAGSMDLLLLSIRSDEGPRNMAKGVFGFDFAPGGKEIWYRTACTREARECDLMAAALEGPPAQPRLVVGGILDFEVSKNGERMLVTYARYDTVHAVDLGWVDLKAARPSQGIDTYTLPGARFLDDAGTRVAYIVAQRKREGVYTADLK